MKNKMPDDESPVASRVRRHRRHGLLAAAAAALLAAAFAGCLRDPPPEPEPNYYNTPLPFKSLTAAEDQVAKMVAKWAALSGRPSPELDPGLTYACRALSRAVAHGGPKAFDEFTNAALQKELLRFGVADSSLRTQMASAVHVSGVESRLGTGIMNELAEGRYTNFGVGETFAWWPPLHYVVLVFSRRPVRLDPFPRNVGIGEAVEVSGELLEGLRRPIVYISDPAGNVHEPLVHLRSDGSFRANIFFNDPGIYRIEVGGDSSLGPEVAALMPVNVGGVADEAEAAGPAPQEDSEEKAKALVLREINRERRAAGLSAVSLYAPLARVAQGHADEMRRLKYAAHASPTTGMAADRATAAGIRWQRITENVAVNQSALAAHASLMESPGHRANVLDGEVGCAGIGVAFADDGHGHRLVYLVENYVALQ